LKFFFPQNLSLEYELSVKNTLVFNFCVNGHVRSDRWQLWSPSWKWWDRGENFLEFYW